MLYWKQILDKKGGNVGNNRVVSLSLFRARLDTTVTITRDRRRRFYKHISHASQQRLCECVTKQVAKGTMGLYLWPEGFWSNVLSERC